MNTFENPHFPLRSRINERKHSVKHWCWDQSWFPPFLWIWIGHHGLDSHSDIPIYLLKYFADIFKMASLSFINLYWLRSNVRIFMSILLFKITSILWNLLFNMRVFIFYLVLRILEIYVIMSFWFNTIIHLRNLKLWHIIRKCKHFWLTCQTS